MTRIILLAAAALASAGVPASAQQAPPMPGPGDLLPDVVIHDDQGEEFQIRRLRGEHSVIVFGCLT